MPKAATEDVRISLYSARGFYFVVYAISFIALGMYDNKLKEAILNPGFTNIVYVALNFGLMISATILWVLAGTNPGLVKDYPVEDVIQGQDYQTGYFVNGKHVKDRQSINAVMQDQLSNETDGIFQPSTDQEKNNESSVAITEMPNLNNLEDRVSEAELKSRITGIEYVAHYEFPKKRFCEK